MFPALSLFLFREISDFFALSRPPRDPFRLDFPRDLKSMGDVRQLRGRLVEIHGQVKEYDGRAEIALQESQQLGGPGAVDGIRVFDTVNAS
jgi:hypothetical protein